MNLFNFEIYSNFEFVHILNFVQNFKFILISNLFTFQILNLFNFLKISFVQNLKIVHRKLEQ
jgi:hypothetical protein